MRKGNLDQFGKCDICREIILVEYYFGKGEEISCCECGTTYKIVSKEPIKLTMLEARHDPDDYLQELEFD